MEGKNDNQDINDINEQTGNMIPFKLEDKILELRESNTIIKCILDQNGCDVNWSTANDDENSESETEIAEEFFADIFIFRSLSQRLSFRIGIKYKGRKCNPARS